MYKNSLMLMLVFSLVFSGICFAMDAAPPMETEEEEFKGKQEEMIAPSQLITNLVKITKANENVFPKVSKSGSIVYQSRAKDAKNFNIYVYSTKGLSIVTNDTHNNQNPGFAGERKIVFDSDRLGLTKLWRIDVSGKGGIVQITSGSSYDLMPDVTADGKKVAYCSFWKEYKPADLTAVEIGARWKTFTEMPSIWTVDSDGKNLTQFGEGIKPSWSPDGKKMTFYRKTGEYYHVWLMDEDGGNLTQFTSGNYNAIEPDWSPDGNKIAYSADSAGNYDIWSQNVDGTELTQLTIHDGYDGAPAWAPGGQYMYFHSFRGGNWNIWRMMLLKEQSTVPKPVVKQLQLSVPEE